MTFHRSRRRLPSGRRLGRGDEDIAHGSCPVSDDAVRDGVETAELLVREKSTAQREAQPHALPDRTTDADPMDVLCPTV